LNDTSTLAESSSAPNKSVEDFEIQRKAATDTFVGTGRSLHIVRSSKTEPCGYGCFRHSRRHKTQTCAPCNQFVRDRKDPDADFHLVRMPKVAQPGELKPAEVFRIELIMAHVSSPTCNAEASTAPPQFPPLLRGVAVKEESSSQNVAPFTSSPIRWSFSIRSTASTS